MKKERKSGVLLNISSLPSPFGIGIFGDEAIKFAKQIKKMGFSQWQILPLNAVGVGNSPYSSDGAFSGNEFYIDPFALLEDGLITEEDISECIYHGTPYTVDYEFAKISKSNLMKKAYANITPEYQKGTKALLKQEEFFNYAFFKSLKEHFEEKPFYEWDSEYAHYKQALKHKKEFEKDIEFHGFCQYVFLRQWMDLKKKVNAEGVEIIGDMPIYVGLDSADVWAHSELFLLDENTLLPRMVAGVPPDYFSVDGQLWGNPLFDWELMEKDDFAWWVNRIKHSLSLYDTLRIDHFRGIASFWAVNAGEKTARNGKWKKGPGMKLFRALNKHIEDPSIIAEDLGEFGKDVERLLKGTGFAGMKVIQFGFGGDDNSHLPHNYPENCIAYTGTHDNDTLLGWLFASEDKDRQYALDYCGFEGDWTIGGYYSPSCRKIIEAVWRSNAYLAVIAFQDMCGFGSDTRVNIPGEPEGNWCPRFTAEQFAQIDAQYFTKLNDLFKRN